MAYTLRDVRSSYSANKAADERHDLMFRFFARPLSFPVALVGLRLGLTPNQVTVGSLILNLLGLGMMASGYRATMAWGVGLLLVSLVLDAADGNMARTAQRFSPLGEWLEGVGAYIIQGAFHVAGGVGAWLALTRGDPITAWPVDQAWGGILVTGGA